MHYRGGGVGHQAVREATNIFLKDRPREELDIGRGEAQDKSEAGEEGEGEPGEEEQAEPPSGTVPTNLQDIPGGDQVVDDEDGDGDKDKNGEEAASESDDEEDKDEGDSDGKVDDTSKYAEL